MQQKTGARLLIKMHPELARALESVPRSNLTFLVTERGAPFSASSLSNWFGKQCRAAGLERRTAHGLRKAACRRLAEAGASVHEIAAVSGHKSLAEIERYTKAVDQARLADQAMDRLRAERELALVQSETRLDKTGEKG
jgi:integrase